MTLLILIDGLFGTNVGPSGCPDHVVGVPVPINVDNQLGDLRTREQVFALVEAVDTRNYMAQ